MSAYFAHAPAVRKIAERLIPKDFKHLDEIRMEYVFRSEAAKSRGRTILGKARLVSNLNALLATHDLPPDAVSEGLDFFVVEIAGDVWMTMTDRQQEALVFHELSHCWVDYEDQDGLPSLQILPHDLECFASEVREYGAWHPAIVRFVHDLGDQRRTLFSDDPIEAASTGTDGQVVQGPWP